MDILAVGIATLDVVNQVERYPYEDAEVRALDQRITRGGNAANTLVVLGQLGHRVGWAGSLAGDAGGDQIMVDLQRRGVDLQYAKRYPDGSTPTSYVTLSRANGSRTIVHYRQLPEYDARSFAAVPIEDFDWIHFEGRNIPELGKMLSRLPPGYPCSLEVEKPRPGIDGLFSGPRLLLFSRNYAHALGFDQAAALLQSLQERLATGSLAVCAWGDQGAWAVAHRGEVVHSPAFPPAQVVDTLGAGDVFNAAVIDQLSREAPLERILDAACRLAGQKCGQWGFDGPLFVI